MTTITYNKRHIVTQKLLNLHRSSMDLFFNYVESAMQKYPILDESVSKIQEATGIKSKYIMLGLVSVFLYLLNKYQGFVFCFDLVPHVVCL